MKVTRLGGTKETSSTKRKSKDAVDSGAFADMCVCVCFNAFQGSIWVRLVTNGSNKST